jgi:hypothetical protein
MKRKVIVTSENEERILLFKNPSGGTLYAQALLTVLCAHSGVTVKLTTYRRLWVSEEVYANPESLEGHKAIMICVDAERDRANKWWVKNFYPIREVIIKKAEIEGDYLALWVEAQGYLKCENYDTYTEDLKKSLPSYPPDEKSYIVYDSKRNLEIVDPENQSETLTAWQNLVQRLASLKAFERAAFFTLIGVKKKKDGTNMNLEKTGLPDPSFAYKLVQNEYYVITISHLLPLHDQREKLGRLEIGLHLPSGLQSDKNMIEIFGRHQSHDMVVKSKTSIRNEYATVEAYPKDPGFKMAPLLSVPIKFSPPSIWKRSLKKIGLVTATLIAVLFYGYGQLMQTTKSYPTLQTLETISPELIGATISALMLVVIPILVSLFVSRRPEE